MKNNSSFSPSAPIPKTAPAFLDAASPDDWHSQARRTHEGIPSLAVSDVNGRMWATWYASPTGSEDSNNYLVLTTSADGGATWREAVIYEPDFQGPVRAFDPELWIAPDGRLRWTWTERVVPLAPESKDNPYAGCAANPANDRLMMVELNAEEEPDLAALTAPDNLRQIARGVMMCKPLVAKDGAWLFPVAHWFEAPSASVYVSTDNGRTFVELGGVTLPTEKRTFDEHNLVELRDGTLRAYIRTKAEPDGLWEAESTDGGHTWGAPRPSIQPHVTSRVFVRRLASGRLLMVKNGHSGEPGSGRRDMTAYLSEDDGLTWPFALPLDSGRTGVSYPDGQQLPDGRIVIAYDFDRRGSRQILFAVFREEDVKAGFFKTPGARPLQTISCGNPAFEGRVEAAIDISAGRQLFVDDFLVESSKGVVRHWNKPVKREAPVVWPGLPGAVPKVTDLATPDDPPNLTCATDGGLWWDPARRKFRLWYNVDWLGDICYAESDDGLSWNFPDLGIVPGTNRIFEHDVIDSWSVTPNYAAANPYADWKLHISSPGGITDDRRWTSPDGIHFEPLGLAGRSDDRSTSYYDPFRGEWVFSLRDWERRDNIGRCRRYFAARDFNGCRWRWSGWPEDKDHETFKDCPEPVEWLVADNGPCRSLYSFNAVAYESVMLGVMEILYNTPHDNDDGMKVGLPKQTGLHFCFSRDGKTFVPRVEADIAPEGWGSGKWDTGYLSVTGGICVIRDERLWFYYSGLRGDGTRLTKIEKPESCRLNGMYSNGSIGVATLRRDGFAGMVADARGEIVTKPLVFTGGHLFVNAECRFGSLVAEILGEDGKPLPGFSAADCAVFRQADSTKTELRFAGGVLSTIAGRPVRLRFLLHCATLYAFWVSPSAHGESRGYVAAGGPDYPGLQDL